MIVRTWGGKVPLLHADAFHDHLMATGVNDYRHQPGCHGAQLWRRDSDGFAHFLLVSEWSDLAALCGYAGDETVTAVLYPGDEAFGLIPDHQVSHYELLSSERFDR